MIVFSPGYTVPHSLYTALLEDLASHGCVVIAVDHTYETEVIRFPDGSTVRGTLPEKAQPLDLRAITARLADVSFVLDRLPSLARRVHLHGVDVTKVGLFGHSLGGLTAANVAASRESVTCAANLAGSVYGRPTQKPFRRPFLILDGQQREATMRSWWARLTGTRYWVTLNAAKHLNFTDWSWLVPALRRKGLSPRVPNLGTIDGLRAVSLERRYLDTFFDECLKNQPTAAFTTPEAGVTIRR